MEKKNRGQRGKKPESFEEWLEILRALKIQEERDRHYHTILSYREWRPRALVHLLDVLDYARNTGRGFVGPAIRPPVMGCSSRTDDVELLLAYLADRSHQLDGHDIAPPHWVEDCDDQGELFPRLLHSLRHLRVAYPLDEKQKETVKEFLLGCPPEVEHSEVLRNNVLARDELNKAMLEYGIQVASEVVIKQITQGGRRDPQSWGEWLARLMGCASESEYLLYLGTALDFPEWRPQAVEFLLDIMNTFLDPDRRLGYEIARSEEASSFCLLVRCKNKAADMIVFDYLSGGRHEKDLWQMDCIKSPELFVRILWSLCFHAHDRYMYDNKRFPKSVVVKFLKSCVRADWEVGPEFREMRKAHLVEFFYALDVYELAHLIVQPDEATIKALEQVVFGPSPSWQRVPYAQPENIYDALLNGPSARDSLVERLCILRMKRKAKQIEELRMKRDQNRKARAERAQRVLAKTQGQAPPVQG